MRGTPERMTRCSPNILASFPYKYMSGQYIEPSPPAPLRIAYPSGAGTISVSRRALLVWVRLCGWPRKRPPHTHIRSAFWSRATLPQVCRGPASLRTPHTSVSRALKNASYLYPPHVPPSALTSSAKTKVAHRTRPHNINSAKVETTYARRAPV